MTRETKIGLIVGGSFLFLVGIVVASKMRGTEDPSEEQAVQVAAVTPKQDAETKDKDGGKKKSEKPIDIQPLPTPPMPQKTEVPKNDLRSPNELTLPAPNGFGTQSEDERIKQLLAKNAENQNPMPSPLPQVGGVQPVELKPFNDSQFPPPQPVKPFEKKDEKQPFKPFDIDLVQVPPPMPIQKKDVQLPPFDKKSDPQEKKEAFPVVPPPSTFGQDIPMPKPFGPIDDKKPSAPVIDSKGPSGVELPPTPSPIKPPDVPVMPAPKDQFPFKPPEVPPIVPVAKDPPFKSVETQKEIPQIPPFNTTRETPPIGLGPKPPLPVVKDASPDIIECKPGDTSFAALSQRLYGSDKYAEALHEYNRKHSGALKNGERVAMAQPILNPGQQVLVPPRELLERDVKTPTVSIAPPPAVKLVPPSPINTVSNPPVSPSIGAGRSYVVQNPNGESILDIAERVLGNRNRWTDIYRLNQSHPNVQPQSLTRIPAGTDLKMPSN
jgi:hypothetical protein